jgi:hypothetical protein
VPRSLGLNANLIGNNDISKNKDFERSSANIGLSRKFNKLTPMENICFINKKSDGNAVAFDKKEELEKEKTEKIGMEENKEVIIDDV